MRRRYGRAFPGVYVARTMQCAAYYPQALSDARHHPLGEVIAADDSPPLRAVLEVWCRADKRLWQRTDGSNQQELYPAGAVIIDKAYLLPMRRCLPFAEQFRRVLPPLFETIIRAPSTYDDEAEGGLTGRRRRAHDGSKREKELARLQRRAADFILGPFPVELEDRAPPWEAPPAIPPRPSKRPRFE